MTDDPKMKRQTSKEAIKEVAQKMAQLNAHIDHTEEGE